MKNLNKQRSFMAATALVAIGFAAPAQADFGFLAHTPQVVSVAYTAPTYYYVPFTPVYYPAPVYYSAPVYYVAPAIEKEKPEPKKKKVEKKPDDTANLNVSPTKLYSNYTYAPVNPVVMVYPPLVYGVGQPLIMW